MNKILTLLCLIFLIPSVFAGSVTRSFSDERVEVGEEIIVSLEINVDSGDLVYAIQEKVPEDAEVVDDGDFVAKENTLRYLKYSGVEDAVKTYKVKFLSSGDYNFSGNYAFGDSGEKEIGGDSEIVVTGISDSGGSSSSSGNSGSSSDSSGTLDDSATQDDGTSGTDLGTSTPAYIEGEEEEKKHNWVWIVVIILVVLIVLILIILFFSLKRKRQQDFGKVQSAV